MSTDTVGQIKERLDIVDLIGKRVPLRQTGRYFKGLCPFHNEKTPSFVVYPESQHYHCFGCGRNGDIFTFVMETDNIDFKDALERLASQANVEVRRAAPPNPKQDERRKRLTDLNELAASFFSNILWSSQRGEAGRALLERRGVDRKTAESFSLGFAPDSWDALKNHLQQRANASEDTLVEAGLCSRSESGRVYDRFRNRLMFPIRDRDGAVIGFGARALGDEMPKYLNSPQTPVFNKSASLYAIEKAYSEIRRDRTIVVVEGYMDAITAHQFGFENVVASMGTALADLQVQSIRRYVDRVFLALDSDAAGQLATLRAIDALRDSFADEATPQVSARRMIRFERSIGAEIRVVLLSEGKDPDELIRSDPTNWTQALEDAIPLVEYVLEARLRDVEQTPAARAEALREIAVPLLREIRDPSMLSDYVDLTARMLNYKDMDVRAALQRRTGARQRDVRPSDRPAALDPERELLRILATYPITVAARQGLLYQVDLANIVDVRNRQVADAIISNEGDVDLALEELQDELRSYLEGIRLGVELRSDMSPGLATNELTQAIQTLDRTRYEERVRQARAAIEDAKQSGDPEALRDSLQRMTDLAARKPKFDPRESPYFRDSRSQVS